MRRLFPYPFLAAAILVIWLLLTQTFSPGQFVLGAIVAVIAGQATAALRLDRLRLRSVGAAMRFAALAAAEIVRSNVAVARMVLQPHRQKGTFVRIPLDLKDRHGLTLLALVVTAIPGTMWVQYDRIGSVLMLHIFDLKDEDAIVDLVQVRYQGLLIEMFEQ